MKTHLLLVLAVLVFLMPTGARRGHAQAGALSPASAALQLPSGGSGAVSFTLSGAPGASWWSATVSAPSGISASVVPSSGTLPTNGLAVLTVQITATQSGVVSLLVLYQSQLLVAHIAVAANAPAVSIAPASASHYISTTRVHTWTVTNLTGSPQQLSVHIGRGAANWPTQLLAPSTLLIPASGSAQVPISVTRPSGATGRYPVQLLLVPQGSGPGWHASAVVTFTHEAVYLPIVRVPVPPGVDAYEPDNTCAQFSQIAPGELQSRTYFTGGAGADVDIIRAVLSGGAQPITYYLRFRGTGAGTQPRLTIFYVSQACGAGASVTYTSTGGAPVVVPIRLSAASSPYSYTLWISSTNATGAWGAGETYTISLSLPSSLTLSMLEGEMTDAGDETMPPILVAGEEENTAPLHSPLETTSPLPATPQRDRRGGEAP